MESQNIGKPRKFNCTRALLEDFENLQTDEDYLIHPTLGYVSGNLKEPLKGFTIEDQDYLLPIVDDLSAKLFDITTKMNSVLKKEVEAAVKAKRGILRICTFPKTHLIHKKFVRKIPAAKRKPALWSSSYQVRLGKDLYSEEKMKVITAPLNNGWKREMVLSKATGSNDLVTTNVYYYSPDAVKFRYSKQIVTYLARNPDTPFEPKNFTFAKVRLSLNPEQEVIRYVSSPVVEGASIQGVSPTAPSKTNKPPHKKKIKLDSHSDLKKDVPFYLNSGSERPVTYTASLRRNGSNRRSMQPSKRYSSADVVMPSSKVSKSQDGKTGKKPLQMGMLPPKYPKGLEKSFVESVDSLNDDSFQDCSNENSEEMLEDSLFQISALHYQSGGFDTDALTELVKSGQLEVEPMQAHEDVKYHKESHKGPKKNKDNASRTDVKPCSIGCRKAIGRVPMLQCVRCLCLYHEQCLELSNSVDNQFFCSKCDKDPFPPVSPPTVEITPETRVLIKLERNKCKTPASRQPPSHKSVVGSGTPTKIRMRSESKELKRVVGSNGIDAKGTSPLISIIESPAKLTKSKLSRCSSQRKSPNVMQHSLGHPISSPTVRKRSQGPNMTLQASPHFSPMLSSSVPKQTQLGLDNLRWRFGLPQLMKNKVLTITRGPKEPVTLAQSLARSTSSPRVVFNSKPQLIGNQFIVTKVMSCPELKKSAAASPGKSVFKIPDLPLRTSIRPVTGPCRTIAGLETSGQLKPSSVTSTSQITDFPFSNKLKSILAYASKQISSQPVRNK